MQPINIIMTGAGAPGASGIIKCLRLNAEREIRIIGVDMKERVGARCMLDDFRTVSPAGAPEFCDELLALAAEYRADAILPLVTRELERFAAEEKRFFDIGTAVCVCPIANLSIANDKGRMLDKLADAGVPVPEYIRVTDAASFAEACAKMGYPDRTICFKPSRANGSRGFRVVSPDVDRSRLLFEEKPNSTYITYEDAAAVLGSMASIPELLVMEFLPGDEYSVDMLVDGGRTLTAIPRKRLAMNGGISVRCLIENNREIIEYCERIAEALGLDGNIGVQVRADSKGRFRILEINPRVQGTIVACLAAGVNLPYLAVKRKLGEPLEPITPSWGCEMIRYWDEAYFDADGRPFSITPPRT